MNAQTAFQRGVSPLLQLLLPGREDAVLPLQPDQPLREHIEELAAKNTEGALSPDELEEYADILGPTNSSPSCAAKPESSNPTVPLDRHRIKI